MRPFWAYLASDMTTVAVNMLKATFHSQLSKAIGRISLLRELRMTRSDVPVLVPDTDAKTCPRSRGESDPRREPSRASAKRTSLRAGRSVQRAALRYALSLVSAPRFLSGPERAQRLTGRRVQTETRGERFKGSQGERHDAARLDALCSAS